MVSPADLESFSAHLRSSQRILALLGAGLSASSGLPTFRGVGGLWRNHDAMTLATPEAFAANPALVWQFYNYRRHMALQAQPNAAHRALAELARRKPGFLTLTQNVDDVYLRAGLSPRAQHPPSQLHLLHGSLFDVRCTSFYCKYVQRDNFDDPIVPALAITNGTTTTHTSGVVDLSDVSVPMTPVPIQDLPHCPQCGDGLLRPGVVWFGEMLPERTIDAIDEWIEESPTIDLMLVIGTGAKVYPAAGYVEEARAKGARVAVVNLDPADAAAGLDGLRPEDWFFRGDAGTVVPEILAAVIDDPAQESE